MVVKRNPSKRLKKQLKSLRSGLNKAQKTAKRQVKSLRSGLKKEKKESLRAKKTSKKAVKRLRSGLKKEKKELQKAKKTARTAVSKTAKLGSESDLLKREIQKLKARKVAKRQLNEYNLFMRKQLKARKTFKQAVSAWKKFKKLLNKRKPSAYNQFIAAQMRMGKTFKQAVTAWNLFKSGKKPRARTKIIRKVVVRRAKPKIRVVRKVIVRKAKPEVRVIVRKAKPKIRVVVRHAKPKSIVRIKRVEVQKPFFPMAEIESIVSKTVSETRQAAACNQPSDEELALRIVRLYFEEIARLGFKRSLDLDEIINSYFYALLRVQRSGIELQEIVEAVKKSKIKRTEF